MVGGKIVYEKDPDAIKENSMKLTKAQLKEIIREELLNEARTMGQETIGNVFITRYSNSRITFHVGGRANSTIAFSRSEAKQLMDVLKGMTR